MTAPDGFRLTCRLKRIFFNDPVIRLINGAVACGKSAVVEVSGIAFYCVLILSRGFGVIPEYQLKLRGSLVFIGLHPVCQRQQLPFWLDRGRFGIENRRQIRLYGTERTVVKEFGVFLHGAEAVLRTGKGAENGDQTVLPLAEDKTVKGAPVNGAGVHRQIEKLPLVCGVLPFLIILCMIQVIKAGVQDPFHALDEAEHVGIFAKVNRPLGGEGPVFIDRLGEKRGSDAFVNKRLRSRYLVEYFGFGTLTASVCKEILYLSRISRSLSIIA